MNTSKSASCKDTDARKVCQDHGSADSSPAIESFAIDPSLAQYKAKISSANFAQIRVACGGDETDKFICTHTYTGYAVKDANGSGNAAIDAH